MTDTRLRELYGRAMMERGTPTRDECPTPERLLALVRREGAESERLELLDHVMSCATCKAEFELVRAIDKAGAETERAAPRQSWRRAVPYAMAASLLLAVGIVGVRSRGGDEGPYRGATTGATAGGFQLLTPDVEIRGGAPTVFAWRPIEGVRRYQLEVLDGEGGVAYAAETSDTTAALPAAVTLRPGVEYRWWVRATTDDGAQRASALRPLRLRAD